MFYENEDRELIATSAREFAEKEIRPRITEMESGNAIPKELFKRFGELGFNGLGYAEEVGGLGVDYVALGMVVEEVAKVSPPTIFTWSTANSSVPDLLNAMGTPEQKEKWLKPNINGDLLFAVSSTEACGGGNFPEFTTKAVLDGDEWVINGLKTMTTNSQNADLFFVVCLTDEFDPATQSGVSLIVVPAITPGVDVMIPEEKIGMHGCSTGPVGYTNVRVPKENLVGPLNGYLTGGAGAQLPASYGLYGAMFLGAAEAAYDKALEYTRTKTHFGVSVFDSYQTVRQALGKMRIEIDMYRSAVYTFLDDLTNGKPDLARAIGLKIKGTKLVEQVAIASIDLYGGEGTMNDMGIEEMLRDAVTLEVGGGSNLALYDTLAYFL